MKPWSHQGIRGRHDRPLKAECNQLFCFAPAGHESIQTQTPHVRIEGGEYDLWMLKGIEQRFERWLERKGTASEAVLGVENGWFVGGRKVMQERVRLRVSPAVSEGRTIDCDFTWTPLGSAVTLAGAEGKSYGGLTLRFAPRANTVITTPLGDSPEDLPMTRLPWADLSANSPARRNRAARPFLSRRTIPIIPSRGSRGTTGCFALAGRRWKRRRFPRASRFVVAIGSGFTAAR